MRQAPGTAQVVDRVLGSITNNSFFIRDVPEAEAAALLGHLERRIEQLEDPSWTFVPVRVNLEDVAEDCFFDLLADALISALAVRLGGYETEECSRPPGDLGFRRLARNLRKLVAELQQGSSKRVKVVLLIQAIGRLNEFQPRVNQKLRSLFMTGVGENLAAVAAGGRIDHHWEREASPWYNFFEEINLVGPTSGSE